ncbi:MAG TPA: alpha/beta fold hydrolase [Verrucomicrobiae bacterium]|nr:alpha/beta fold hydrolase [Verrucomicrobiae bacterium]
MLCKTLIAFTFFITTLLASAQTTRTVRLNTPDDVGIIGTFYPTDQPHAPAVLLLHSILRDRSVWNDFATLLQHNGIAALTIDLRGHGESTRKLTAEGPIKIDVRNLMSRDYQDMLLDVEAAIDWLQTQPEIDKKRIALIGESFGANIALRYAAINEDLSAVALFSPGLNYRGVRTDDVIRQLGQAPFHIFVSQNDAFAFESSKRLVEIRQESGIDAATNQLTVCTGSLHGTEMLKGVRNLPQIVLSWLKDALPEIPAAPSNAPRPAPLRDPTAPVK